jgi:hypothetical protein
MSEVNRLKTDILNIINDEILALDTSDIGVPMGSLILPELISGRGPAIPVRILSIRNSDATFLSNFVQAGINQTLHQLAGNLFADRVKTADDHRLGSIIDKDTDTGRSFDGTDIASLTADDAALQLVGGKRNSGGRTLLGTI